MEEQVTLEFIEQSDFIYDGLFRNEKVNKEKALYKMPSSYSLPISDEEKSRELRKAVNKIIDDKFDTLVSAATRSEITLSSFKAYVSGSRTFKREALAKFCIAAKLSVAQAENLFQYTQYGLDPKNCLLDAVLVYCLNNDEPISELERVMLSKGVEI